MISFLNTWVLKPEYLPAYLQFLAALVALGISVWSVWLTTANTRRRDRREIRGLAVAIYPEIRMLKESTKGVKERIRFLKSRYGELVGQSVGASVQLAAQIDVPPMLERNIDRLFILGDLAGPSCVQLVRLIIQYNSLVGHISQSIMTMNAEQWSEAVEPLGEHLDFLDQVVDKCEHELRPIHNAIKG